MGITTQVVNVRTDDYDVYIGRANPRHRLAESPFSNPFRIEACKRTREQAIAEYRDWVLTSNDLRAEYIRLHVHELRGKRLGCWCAPAACHGSVLAKMAEEVGVNISGVLAGRHIAAGMRLVEDPASDILTLERRGARLAMFYAGAATGDAIRAAADCYLEPLVQSGRGE